LFEVLFVLPISYLPRCLVLRLCACAYETAGYKKLTVCSGGLSDLGALVQNILGAPCVRVIAFSDITMFT